MGKDERWMQNYLALQAYVAEHKQLPDKKKVENRGLLNWWKYNRKCIKDGKLSAEKQELLYKISEMRTVHR